MESICYTPKEVAPLLKVSEQTIRIWIKKGKLRAVKSEVIGLLHIAKSEIDKIVSGKVFTTYEVAAKLKKSEQTIRRWIKQGKLNATKTTVSHFLYISEFELNWHIEKKRNKK